MRELEILAHLGSNEFDDDFLENYVVHWTENGQIFIYVKLPQAGDYSLKLYAKDKDAEGKIFTY